MQNKDLKLCSNIYEIWDDEIHKFNYYIIFSHKKCNVKMDIYYNIKQ